MSDRFKFRCWNKLENKMFYVIDISWFYEEIKKIRAFEPETKNIFIFDEYDRNIENTILMQSTGLKDKNGKLIYEGDIVRFKDNVTIKGSKTHISVVEHNEAFNAFMYHAECMGLYTVNKAQNERFDVEVIGNIYENPELLKE